MTIDLFLEWFHEGAWHRIGWTATNERSKEDLRQHGASLAAAGGWYRLTEDGIYRNGPVGVVHEYTLVSAGGAA